ncbi:hypothetical protein I7I53_02658 [Histoplasma capsulatum var. duboisii H88]|uniref:Uncharacterized protein n=1 Tax=Ajellomyces capsulatus (strain H88) TaxID=544711 RepID=A0A8A1LLX2_AJEC8|nr:hypothetical protein I7I53_02658 [Histoplasma capsulatum var. duboisii H88]
MGSAWLLERTSSAGAKLTRAKNIMGGWMMHRFAGSSLHENRPCYLDTSSWQFQRRLPLALVLDTSPTAAG